VTRIAAQALAIGAIRGKLPPAQAPQLCSLVGEPPEGNGWVSEIKFDGNRLLAAVEDGMFVCSPAMAMIGLSGCRRSA
jgi:ATP-dependent DNA ligase